MDRLEELRELDDPGDETSYLDRAIANFLTGALREVAAVSEAAADGRLDVVSAVAHRLAGSALNLGAGALGEAARELEEQARNGDAAGGHRRTAGPARGDGRGPRRAPRLPARAVPGPSR